MRPDWTGCPHPLDVKQFLDEKFGTDWPGWELDTLHDEIVRDGSQEPSREALDMVGALQALLTTSYFWENWVAFEKICRALIGLPVHPEVMQQTDIPSLAAACDAVKNIRSEEFNEEVGKYVAARAFDSGHTALPECLGFADPFLDRILAQHGVEGEPCPPYSAETLDVVAPADTDDLMLRQAQLRHDVTFAIQTARRARAGA